MKNFIKILFNRNKIKKYTIDELIKLKELLTEKGKEEKELIQNMTLKDEESYKTVIYRIKNLQNLLKDLVNVKTLIQEINVKTNNHKNIVERESAKLMLSTLLSFAKNRKSRHLNFFNSTLNYSDKIGKLRSKIDSITEKMKEINQNKKISLYLYSDITI